MNAVCGLQLSISTGRKLFSVMQRYALLKSASNIFVKPASLKSYSTAGNLIGTKNVKEVCIPLSYGNIAAKAWGCEDAYPTLAFHGWLDNCGTFDNLFPLLSDQFHLLGIDLPGHGMSSHKPPGSFYSDISLIMDLKKVSDLLGWQKFNIIAHSMGGALALMFSSLFPENVNKLVLLDIAKPSSRSLNLFPSETIKAVKSHLEIERKMAKPAPVYTPESAAERLRQGMYNEVTIESANILLKRGTRPSDCGKGVVFSRDIRCRTIEIFSRKSHEYVLQFMSAFKCELMIIMAKNTHPNYITATPEVMDLFLDTYKRSCKKFVLEHVEGNHFVHLNNPEVIAPLINNFLLT